MASNTFFLISTAIFVILICDQFKQAEAQQDNGIVSTVMTFINDIFNIVKWPLGIDPTPASAPTLNEWINNLVKSFIPPKP